MSSLSFARKTAWIPVLILTPIAAFAADEGRVDAGLRVLLTAANGVPANDIPGVGVYGRYRLNDRWSVGLSFEQTKFDYEEPARRLGLPIDRDAPPIDAKADMQIVSALVERVFPTADSRRQWFAGAALGLAFTDVPDVTGPTTTGGSFDIRTEVDRELILSLQGGVRQHFGENWFAEFTLRADQHFAAWEPEDRVSGVMGRHDDYFAYGFHVGIGYRF